MKQGQRDKAPMGEAMATVDQMNTHTKNVEERKAREKQKLTGSPVPGQTARNMRPVFENLPEETGHRQGQNQGGSADLGHGPDPKPPKGW